MLLTHMEIIHLRATIEESRERSGALSPAFDAMVEGHIEKLGLVAKPFSGEGLENRPDGRTKHRTALLVFLTCVAAGSLIWRLL